MAALDDVLEAIPHLTYEELLQLDAGLKQITARRAAAALLESLGGPSKMFPRVEPQIRGGKFELKVQFVYDYDTDGRGAIRMAEARIPLHFQGYGVSVLHCMS